MKAMPRLLAIVGATLTAGAFVTATKGAQSLPSGLNAKLQMEYYDVSGRTWQEVLGQITRSRPIVPGTGERFQGVTSYKVKLGPEEMFASGRCLPGETTVDLSIIIKMPRLADDAALNDRDQECWALFDRSLTDHEEGHMQLVLTDGQALLAALRSVEDRSCRNLQSIANRQLVQMLDNQRVYDSLTEHGLAQWRRFGLDNSTDSEATHDLKRRCSS